MSEKVKLFHHCNMCKVYNDIYYFQKVVRLSVIAHNRRPPCQVKIVIFRECRSKEQRKSALFQAHFPFDREYSAGNSVWLSVTKHVGSSVTAFAGDHLVRHHSIFCAGIVSIRAGARPTALGKNPRQTVIKTSGWFA